jgi:glycosyltransferase involved in cell wall biosynthesis
MRVLQVADGLPPEQWGGAEQFCARLAHWLASAGVDVDVAAPSGSDFPERRSLHKVKSKYLRKLFFDLFSPANAQRLRSIIAEVRPDVIHVHNIYGISSQVVYVASQACPTVVTVHGYWPIDLFSPMVRDGRWRFSRQRSFVIPWVWLHRFFHRKHLAGATLVSPSRYLARRLEEFGYHDVRVIPNGVALPAETTAADNRVLFVGRLVPEKGLHEVLQPLETVAREFGWQVDIVGDGPQRAGLARACPSVRFHGQADPAPFYRRAGIVVIPSLWPENFPYVVLEAMGYGVPVLASNVGGVSEIVEDGVTGRLYDPGAGEQFVSALRELALDGALRERMGHAARERIAREFTWASVGPRYLALYEELAPAGVAGRATVRVS